ncbi:MAG: hypothetical protein B6D55_06695 [Candidatus Omnitrophica bacterium 4484_70.2]|nr:MAG: hypothetical protein B6D55_06695 [Candidatus Omnitrophica bacterium 4484_70.2]
MMLRAKIKEEYIYGGVILILVFLSFPLSFRILLPKFKLYKTFFKDITKKEKELRVIKSALSQVERLREEIRGVEDKYNSLMRKVVPRPESLEAIKIITGLIEGLKIEFYSFQPLPLKKIGFSSGSDNERPEKFSPKKEADNFFIWEIPVAIKIKTNYANLMNFIKRIEGASKFVKIKDIRIAKDLAFPFAHDAQITVSVFSLPSLGKIKKKR